MYKPLADEETVPFAAPVAAPVATTQPVAIAAPVLNSSAIHYTGSNEAFLRTHVDIPPQACQVIVQTVFAILAMLLGAAAVALEVVAESNDQIYRDNFVYGLAVAAFVPAFIISCIALPIMCQTICVKRSGENALDLNSSLSCQVTTLTALLAFSIFIDSAASLLAYNFNTNTSAGIIYASLLAAMALFNFIGTIFGCCATCSSNCGSCCNCDACCVTRPVDYRMGRPNQLGSGHGGSHVSVTSSMQSYGAYQTTPQ